MFGLELIKKLKPVIFRYDTTKLDTDNRKHFGLIAQDVNLVLDEYEYSVVQKDGQHYMVNYLELVAPLIKAVQELSKKVEKLEKEISDGR